MIYIDECNNRYGEVGRCWIDGVATIGFIAYAVDGRRVSAKFDTMIGALMYYKYYIHDDDYDDIVTYTDETQEYFKDLKSWTANVSDNVHFMKELEAYKSALKHEPNAAKERLKKWAHFFEEYMDSTDV